jgi:hypothetical protein
VNGVPSHLTPLRLAQPATVDLEHAARLLNSGASAWLGASVSGPDPATHRFLTDLELPIRDHVPSVTFKKAAYVDLGAVKSDGARCEVEIGWRSSSLAPLFPVFAGRLIVTATQLTLEGYYAPPGGDVGAVLDKAFLNIAARGTARWFLGRVADALRAPAPEAL